MVIKLLQQSTFRRYAAIVLSPFFYFCCFRCIIMPLTGVINYVFCIYCHYRHCKHPCCRCWNVLFLSFHWTLSGIVWVFATSLSEPSRQTVHLIRETLHMRWLHGVIPPTNCGGNVPMSPQPTQKFCCQFWNSKMSQFFAVVHVHSQNVQ